MFDSEALEQEEKKRNTGQRQQQGVAMGCCRCGSTHPSRVKRGGDRIARRDRQRVNRDRSRDDRKLLRILARTLSPLQGGSIPRTAERPSKLQLLQQFAVAGFAEGDKIQSKKDQAIYVGITNPTNRLAVKNGGDGDQEEKTEKDKKGQVTAAGTMQQNKAPRGIDDGLLLVVPARINGHTVRALIDSGATRCFVTPSCVTAVGLKGTPQDIFLELGNGQKYLSRGHVPDATVVTAGLTVRVGLTVTNLLHEVDLMLGINWLQLVNPVVDWSSGKIYLPNAVHTALLQGDWLEGHVKSGTVTVLAGGQELSQMNDAEERRKISILKCPKFWKMTQTNANSWTNSFKGRVSWGYLYKMECDICKSKNICNDICKHWAQCKLYSFHLQNFFALIIYKRI